MATSIEQSPRRGGQHQQHQQHQRQRQHQHQHQSHQNQTPYASVSDQTSNTGSGSGSGSDNPSVPQSTQVGPVIQHGGLTSLQLLNHAAQAGALALPSPMHQHFAHAPNSAFIHAPGQVPAVGGVSGLSGLVGAPSAHSVAFAAPNSEGVETANYKDYSRVAMEDAASSSSMGNNSSSGKDPSFPVKLHRILSVADHEQFITWLPHGRSWRVLKPKAFEAKVIPLYFRHAKYASFMRQVNGWGFRRITQGPDHNSYYHEMFLRGLPHLCRSMQRPPKSKQGSSTTDDANIVHPDFYHLSLIAPLPTTPMTLQQHQKLQNQRRPAYVTSVSTSPTNAGSAGTGSGEGSCTGSGDCPRGTRSSTYDSSRNGGTGSREGSQDGSSSGKGKNDSESADSSADDNQASDTERMADAVPGEQRFPGSHSSSSSAYAGGSEGGGDSSSDSDKYSENGQNQDNELSPSSNKKAKQADPQCNESSSKGTQRTQRIGSTKRRSSSNPSEVRKENANRNQSTQNLGAVVYPMMNNTTSASTMPQQQQPMQIMQQFPGQNYPYFVVQQPGGGQGQPMIVQQQQMQPQQQPQFLRVVNQNGGEVGYIQLPSNPGMPAQMMQGPIMVQSQNGGFVQGQVMQGMPPGLPSGMQGVAFMSQQPCMQQQGMVQAPQVLQSQLPQHPQLQPQLTQHSQLQPQLTQQHLQQQMTSQQQLQQQLSQSQMVQQHLAVNPQLMNQGLLRPFQPLNAGTLAFSQVRHDNGQSSKGTQS